MSRKRLRVQHLALGLMAALLFMTAGPLRTWLAHGDNLGSRSLQLSDSRASQTANYILTFDGVTDGAAQSVRAQFCANDPLIGKPCTAPSGFDVSQATLTAQSGMTGFSIDTTDTTSNVLILTRSRGAVATTASSYTLTGVTNPSAIGSYYVRLETFMTSNASGADTDFGGLAFSIGNAVNISTYVPPYLLFCTAITIQPYDCSTAVGNYIDFGDFKPTSTATGHTEILAATNGDNGYNIRVVGTTLTSGNNEIPALTTPDVSRQGVSQFGLNLRANNTPAAGDDAYGPGSATVTAGYNTPDFYRFNSGDIIAGSPTADDYRLYTANYVVNVSKSQSPGVYVSTITYIGLANF